jgi:hypothetical protein
MVRTIKGVSYGLLCFLAGAALVLLAGASSSQEAPVGRYQISATTGGAYILDTQTGHLWGRPSLGAVSYDLGTLEHPKLVLVEP